MMPTSVARTAIRERAQRVADHPFVAADRSLRQCPTIVARGGDNLEMLVTLRWGGLNSGTRYHPLTRWHNHRSTRVTLSNCTINVVSVVSPIAGE